MSALPDHDFKRRERAALHNICFNCTTNTRKQKKAQTKEEIRRCWINTRHGSWRNESEMIQRTGCYVKHNLSTLVSKHVLWLCRPIEKRYLLHVCDKRSRSESFVGKYMAEKRNYEVIFSIRGLNATKMNAFGMQFNQMLDVIMWSDVNELYEV